MGFLQLALTFSTTFSFLPGLKLIFDRSRHFECFIGSLQFLSSLLFSVSSSLDIKILGIDANSYHTVSDICTETYVCLLCIHLCGLRSETTLHMFRYLAFTLCWFAKLGDGWTSTFLEAMVLIVFIGPPLFLMIFAAVFNTQKNKRLVPTEQNSQYPFTSDKFIYPLNVLFGRALPYSKKYRLYSFASVGVGVLFLFLELTLKTNYSVFNSVAHVAFGCSSYFLWNLLPCFDKRDEDYLLPGGFR